VPVVRLLASPFVSDFVVGVRSNPFKRVNGFMFVRSEGEGSCGVIGVDANTVWLYFQEYATKIDSMVLDLYV